MGFCPDQCTTVTLPTVPVNCQPSVRRKTPARIGFYACSTDLGDPVVAETIETLIASNAIIFSSQLSTVAFGDPTFEEVQVSDCKPPQRFVSSREVTFMDKEALIGTTGSPATPVPYADWDIWNELITKSPSLNMLVMYCDGDVIIPTDAAGVPLSIDIQGWVNYSDPATGGGARTEQKNISIVANGDMLSMANKPSFNINQNTGAVTVL
jgi:hypothetical protein